MTEQDGSSDDDIHTAEPLIGHAVAEPDPEDLVEPEGALPDVRLEDLPDSFREAAARAGWTTLMPVQAKTIPYMLAERDLMVQSRTGSGKTGAFMLPMLETIDRSVAACQVLILVPTRELASQVAGQSELLAGADGPSTIAVYGGVGYGPQLEAFQKGCEIVVGTPGRVLDHLLKGTLSLSRLKFLVLDEADRMLSMGFYPDMQRLKQFLPSHRVQGAMFSATFPQVVKSLALEFLLEPGFLSLSRDKVHVAETVHAFYAVPAMDKDRCLVRIIEIENPSSAIIFCNRKTDVEYVSVVLQRFGYDAAPLSSDLSQAEREKVLDRVRRGKLRFLVATDVAARGIDILDLSHVIQYGPPNEQEAYIHRTGRTGRAGATGEALTLLSGLERVHLLLIGKRYGIELEERDPPTDEQVQAVVAERTTALLEARLRDKNRLEHERMRRFRPLARDLGQNEDEVDLVAMLLDDYYQETLHAPVAPVEPAPPKSAPRRSDKPRDGGDHKRRGRRRRGGGGRGRR